MRAHRGRIAGILESPHQHGITDKHFDFIHIGRTVLPGIHVPRKLLPMLAQACKEPKTTVYIDSQRLVGIDVGGCTYYRCNRLSCRVASLFFVVFILLALFAYPSARVWPTRIMVMLPYAGLLVHTWLRYSDFKVLREAPGAVTV